MQETTIDQLCRGILEGTIHADHIDNAGWHFSHFAGGLGATLTIANDFHPEEKPHLSLGTTEALDPASRHSELLLREGASWHVVGLDEMPAHVQNNPQRYGHLMISTDVGLVASPEAARQSLLPDAPTSINKQQPVIICPYVFDEDREQTIQAFGLDQPHGRHLPFFFWKDEKLIGPERAFEQCWKQFPDRDVIIVHTDMRPMPDDISNAWYTDLCAQVEQLPDAGLVGCDLLYPLKSAAGLWYVQCAGGFFKNGRVTHVGGGVALAEGVATDDAYEYDERFAKVRSSQWVTFGGVYIRRETIDMVGDFDERYQWAYVMDVDYCLEAHVRGQGIYQVPVNLLHEESKTSRKFLSIPEYGTKIGDNMGKFLQKWAWFLSPPT